MPELTLDLFSSNTIRPGSIGCRAEVTAIMSNAMKIAVEKGISREEIAARMSAFLGEKIAVGSLNGLVAPSHTSQAAQTGAPVRDISFIRAMAFDAAIEADVLIKLFADKIGGRRVISSDDAALLEWAKLHHEEKALNERKKMLEVAMKVRGVRK